MRNWVEYQHTRGDLSRPASACDFSGCRRAMAGTVWWGKLALDLCSLHAKRVKAEEES